MKSLVSKYLLKGKSKFDLYQVFLSIFLYLHLKPLIFASIQTQIRKNDRMVLNNLKTLIWTKKCVYKTNKRHLDLIDKLCHFLRASSEMF